MKKLLFIIFSLCINSLFAQNYQNICTTGTTFYRPFSTYLKAFRLDSLYLLGNNDTLFISYRTIREYIIGGNCHGYNKRVGSGRKST